MPYKAHTWGFYGDTRTGKTTLALQEASAEAAVAGIPLVIIDSLGSDTFDKLRGDCEVGTVRALCLRVWKNSRPALYLPKNSDEVESIAEIASEMGHAGQSSVILIDETSLWFSAWFRPPKISLLLRGHHHCRVSVFLTTQYLGDLSPAYLQCVERHRIFRNSSPRALARLAETFPGIPLEEVRVLPVGQHIDFPPP